MEPDRRLDYIEPYLEPDMWEDVYVSSADTPTNFYCQFANTSVELADMSSKLQEYCNSTESCELVLTADIVQSSRIACLALFHDDNLWYRALIQEVVNNSQVKVLFVDYGNEAVINCSDLRAITPEFVRLPRQAISGTLEGFPQSTRNWSDKDINEFFNLTLDKDLIMNVKSVQPDPNSSQNQYTLELYHMLLYDDERFNINSQFAKLTDRRIQRTTAPPEPPHAYGSNPPVASVAGAATAATKRRRKPVVGSNSIKELELDDSMYVDVVVCHVENPGHFYCQLVKNSEELDKLMDTVSEEYISLPAGERVLNNLSVGQVCTAIFSEDDNWYRAMIIQAGRSSVKVRFIDYGNEEEVSLDKVKALTEPLQKLPVQAFKCKLTSVAPLGSDGWSDKATEKFRDLTSADNLVCGLVEKNHDGSYTVELVNSKTTVHDDLFRTGFAKSLEPEIIISKGQGRGRSPASSSGSLSSTRSTGSIQKVYTPVPVKDLNYITLSHGPGKTPDDVHVVFVTTPERFFCQLPTNTPQLEQLMDRLQTDYKNIAPGELSLNNPREGHVCCAQYSVDNSWYRAEIVGTENRNIRVRFLDYGNKDTVAPDQVKILKSEYLRLPVQVVNCSLNGVEPVAGSWTTEASDKFEQLTITGDDVNKLLQCEVVSFEDSIFKVVLKDGQESLADLLVASGFARAEGQAVYSDVVLPPGSVQEACVSWANSPSEFWCQLASSAKSLTTLVDQLIKYYEKLKLSEQTCRSVQPGLACVAPYTSDGCWYRAQIISSEGGTTTVQFVDYGNLENIPTSKVKQITSEFLQLPRQAVKCKLLGSDTSRGQDLMNQFSKVANGIVKLHAKQTIGDTVEVDLINERGQSVSEALFKPAPAQPPQQRVQQPQQQAFQATRQPDSGPTSYKATGCGVHDGQTIDIALVHVDAANSFYVQLGSNITAIETMMENLEVCYSTPAADLAMSRANIGQPCAAKFSDDQWYRAKVKKASGRQVEVQFVDYGNSDTVSMDNVKVLKKEFLDLEPQAIECELAGICSTSEEIKAKLDELLEKEIKAEVRSTRPKLSVVLVDEGVNINEDIKKTCIPQAASIQPSDYPAMILPKKKKVPTATLR